MSYGLSWNEWALEGRIEKNVKQLYMLDNKRWIKFLTGLALLFMYYYNRLNTLYAWLYREKKFGRL